jgi:hypothetical protein
MIVLSGTVFHHVWEFVWASPPWNCIAPILTSYFKKTGLLGSRSKFILVGISSISIR